MKKKIVMNYAQIEQTIFTTQLIDKLIANNDEVLQEIGKFVLLVGKLEGLINAFLFLLLGEAKDRPLGEAIEELEKEFINFNYGNIRHYAEKIFLKDNIKSFIKQSGRVNALRNDLFHNSLSPKKFGVKSLEQVLESVKKLLIGASSWDIYTQDQISRAVLEEQNSQNNLIDDRHLHLVGADEKIKNLPICGLIEVCQIFIMVIKQSQNFPRKDNDAINYSSGSDREEDFLD